MYRRIRVKGLMKYILISFMMLVSLFLNGCATKTIEIHPKKEGSSSKKKIALFLDGTANDRDSRTNVSKLYEIVANQDKDNLYLYYGEGVGTDGRFLGAMIGRGIGQDVQDAYSFLSDHYEKDTSLYIFGFSRGAYTARILAGMLNTVGIYDLSVFNEEDKAQIVKELYYDAYKGKNKSKGEIKQLSINIIKKWREKRYMEKYVVRLPSIDSKNISINIMGLWDTVEALGVIPSKEALETKFLNKEDPLKMSVPNDRYHDSICNINKVFHALSLDDNRQNVFTPVIMTHQGVNKSCPQKSITKIVDEVWFSGAHADVGGGYNKDNSLSGVSLNWMIESIRKHDSDDGLIPNSVKVYDDRFGKIHDSESGIKFAYNRVIRGEVLKKYIQESVYEKLKIHDSVFKRLKHMEKWKGYNSYWYKYKDNEENEYFKKCFHSKDEHSYNLKKCELIEKVK